MRMKTEFLTQIDGVSTTSQDRILIIGATNRPEELDEAVLRRMTKKLYIPLPNDKARVLMVERALKAYNNDITEENMQKIVELSTGFSGADMSNLMHEVSMGPIREISHRILETDVNSIRDISFKDFLDAFECVKPSVSQDGIEKLISWNKKFGSFM
jgi:SpoVK/Ycf46/Vps4 family AAA+-type ATPase